MDNIPNIGNGRQIPCTLQNITNLLSISRAASTALAEFAAGSLTAEVPTEVLMTINNLLRSHTDKPSAAKPAWLRQGKQPRLCVAKEPLTPRELQVMIQVARGLTTNEIAQILSISFKTVEIYRTNILRKLDAYTVADITRYAITSGFVTSPHALTSMTPT